MNPEDQPMTERLTFYRSDDVPSPHVQPEDSRAAQNKLPENTPQSTQQPSPDDDIFISPETTLNNLPTEDLPVMEVSGGNDILIEPDLERLTPLMQSIVENVRSINPQNMPEADKARVSNWVLQNENILRRLYGQGYLTNADLQKFGLEVQNTAQPDVQEAAPSGARIEVQVDPNEGERVNGLNFNRTMLEMGLIEDQIRRGGLTEQQTRDLESRKQLLGGRMTTLMRQADSLDLFADVENKFDEINLGLLQLRQGQLRPDQVRALDRKISTWRDENRRPIPGELEGVRQFKLDRLKGLALDQLRIAREVPNTAHPDAFMAQVMNITETQIVKRLAGFETKMIDQQRDGIRYILTEIERNKAGSGKTDSGFKGEVDQLLKIADRLPNDNLESAKLKAEVYARVHLHSCAAAIRKMVLNDAEKPSQDFERLVKQEIGDFILTPADFNLLLVEGLHGYKLPEAFTAMQEAAQRGMYSGKKDDNQMDAIRSELVGQMMRQDPTLSRDVVETSYDLAYRLAEATFERQVWDTAGGDNISQAIYFSAYRIRDGKGPQISREHIHSLGTSFLRSLKFVENDAYVVNNMVRQSINSNTIPEKQRSRYALLQANGLRNQDLDQILLHDLGGDPNLLRNIQMQSAQIMAAGGGSSSLSFQGVDFKRTSEKNAYSDYLTGTLPNMIKAKNLLLNDKFDYKDFNESNYLDWDDLISKIDPKDTQNIRFWFFMGGVQSFIWRGKGEGSEADGVVKEAASKKLRRKNGQEFTFLPYKIFGMTPAEFYYKKMKTESREGHSNANSRFIEGTLKTRR